MRSALAARQRGLRAEIARLVSSPGAEPPPARVDVVVSHVEVCDAHGTGLLTRQLFGDGSPLVSLRSRDQYGGRQEFGERALRLVHDGSRAGVLGEVLAALRDHEVSRAVCIPYFAEDAATALAVKDVFSPPLCTFVMDDNNVEGHGIPDALLAELLARSELRLAISPQLRDAYARKFGLPFAFVPPLVAPALIRAAPAAEAPAGERGVIVGNIWGDDWLARLRATLRGTGLALDWYSNAAQRGAGPGELAADGILVRGTVPDAALVERLRRAPYVVVPSGTLDPGDSRRAIARFSLPSRIAYVLATSHAPIVVLGHPDTAAARFVTGHGVGAAAPYERARFLAAVAAVSAPATRRAMRARAAELAPLFTSEGAREWIWRSLAAGKPVDARWERLDPERNAAC